MIELRCPRCASRGSVLEVYPEHNDATVCWSRGGFVWTDRPTTSELLDPLYGCGYCGPVGEVPGSPSARQS